MRTIKDFLGSPGLSRFSSEGSALLTMRGADFKSIESGTTSFKNDPPGSPLRSTQQIPLDWSVFENHTFFSSAEVNVNVAFDEIINGFPFDGQKIDIENFLDGLTGFEKWIFDNFPKHRGALHFKNSYIEVNDVPGAMAPDISKKVDGQPVLDPGNGSISFQFKAFFPEQINDNQVLLQRLSSTSGYTLAISASTSTTKCDLIFIVSSGSAHLSSSYSINKGNWIDIAACFNRRPSSNRTLLYLDGILASSSSRSYEFYEFNTVGSLLTIGTGSSHTYGSNVFLPKQNLSASLDDFKIFHGNRSSEKIKMAISSSQYPEDNLKLFYKFNEPSGSYSQKTLILDHSGNGLHSNVIGYVDTLRSNLDGLATFKEALKENPILFPDYDELITLNQKLLLSASKYDEINPNLITRLVPPHYFFEGRLEQGFETDEGPVVETYPASGNRPGNSKLGAAQILSALLYVWAKQFDEMKIYLDHFSKIESFEYVDMGSISDQFLVHQARNIGIELPQLFSTIKPNDEIDGNDFGVESSSNTMTLQEIQSQIWRRLLASIPTILREKGTISSVKELIRAFGVNPDTSIRLREYGGAREGVIEARRPRRISAGKLLPKTGYTITSPFLSGSRIEPGVPEPQGNIGLYGSDDVSDGLFTSSSWTYEATYRFQDDVSYSNESLVRFYTTGSFGTGLLFNLIASKSGSKDDNIATLTLYGSTDTISSNAFSISIDGRTLYDGDRWHISFGRQKIGDFESKYFLRLGKQQAGQPIILDEEILYLTNSSNTSDVLSNINSINNASGTCFQLGNYVGSINTSFIDPYTLPGSTLSTFGGEVSGVKFYSKYLFDTEWYEHVTNHESLGVKNPLVNFNFTTLESGSFERLRLDTSFDQEEINADSYGKIIIFDYSQNNLHLSGSGFFANETILGSDDIIFSSLDPKFDERSTDNKVRIRSFQSYALAKAAGVEIAPIYEVPKYEQGNDDNRFGIEISIVQGLNEDIIKMFSDLTIIDNAIGDPTSLFDDSYPDLEDMRDVYFNRLTGIPEYSNVVLFSKWFESTLSRLIEQFLPANSRFLGVNLVVESHMLERTKMKYHWGDLYLGENNRRNLRGTIGLAKLSTNVRRF